MCHLKKAALLQGMMQQQQAGQQNSTVVQQSTSSEKLRDQAHPSKQAWNDSKSLPHPQGSLQRPTSGPVQGIPTHHQRVQNSMNAQFGSMASPPQLSHAPSPQSNGQLPSQGQNPPQGQIPPQYLPQLQGCFVAMHKAAGQGGVGMSQARPLAPVSQDRGVGADPSALPTITSGPASGGLHNPGVMYSSMQQGQAGSTSAAPILTSNFVAFHPVSQGGDSRMLHSGSRHQPSGVYLNSVPLLQLAMLTFRDLGVHSLSTCQHPLYSCIHADSWFHSVHWVHNHQFCVRCRLCQEQRVQNWKHLLGILLTVEAVDQCNKLLRWPLHRLQDRACFLGPVPKARLQASFHCSSSKQVLASQSSSL